MKRSILVIVLIIVALTCTAMAQAPQGAGATNAGLSAPVRSWIAPMIARGAFASPLTTCCATTVSVPLLRVEECLCRRPAATPAGLRT